MADLKSREAIQGGSGGAVIDDATIGQAASGSPIRTLTPQRTSPTPPTRTASETSESKSEVIERRNPSADQLPLSSTVAPEAVSPSLPPSLISEIPESKPDPSTAEPDAKTALDSSPGSQDVSSAPALNSTQTSARKTEATNSMTKAKPDASTVSAATPADIDSAPAAASVSAPKPTTPANIRLIPVGQKGHPGIILFTSQPQTIGSKLNIPLSLIQSSAPGNGNTIILKAAEGRFISNTTNTVTSASTQPSSAPKRFELIINMQKPTSSPSIPSSTPSQSTPLLPGVSAQNTPLPTRVSAQSTPLPTQVFAQSTPLPTRVFAQSTPLQPRVFAQSTPLPTQVFAQRTPLQPRVSETMEAPKETVEDDSPTEKPIVVDLWPSKRSKLKRKSIEIVTSPMAVRANDPSFSDVRVMDEIKLETALMDESEPSIKMETSSTMDDPMEFFNPETSDGVNYEQFPPSMPVFPGNPPVQAVPIISQPSTLNLSNMGAQALAVHAKRVRSGVVCCVPGCPIQMGTDKTYLFQLPKDRIEGEPWVKFLRKIDPLIEGKITTSSKICDRHFKEECFENLLMFKMGFGQKLRMKIAAVPTFAPDLNSNPQSPPAVPTSSGSSAAGVSTTVVSTTVSVPGTMSDNEPKYLFIKPGHKFSNRERRCIIRDALKPEISIETAKKRTVCAPPRAPIQIRLRTPKTVSQLSASDPLMTIRRVDDSRLYEEVLPSDPSALCNNCSKKKRHVGVQAAKRSYSPPPIARKLEPEEVLPAVLADKENHKLLAAFLHEDLKKHNRSTAKPRWKKRKQTQEENQISRSVFWTSFFNQMSDFRSTDQEKMQRKKMRQCFFKTLAKFLTKGSIKDEFWEEYYTQAATPSEKHVYYRGQYIKSTKEKASQTRGPGIPVIRLGKAKVPNVEKDGREILFTDLITNANTFDGLDSVLKPTTSHSTVAEFPDLISEKERPTPTEVSLSADLKDLEEISDVVLCDNPFEQYDSDHSDWLEQSGEAVDIETQTHPGLSKIEDHTMAAIQDDMEEQLTDYDEEMEDDVEINAADSDYPSESNLEDTLPHSPPARKYRQVQRNVKKCQICAHPVNYKLPDRKVCTRHHTTKDGITLFKCIICLETCSTEDEYIEHSAKCRPTVCPVCGYQATNSKRNKECDIYKKLRRHLFIHAKDKPFICDTCGRGFTQANNLKGHLRQHTGEKPFVCEHCGLSFTHRVSLRKHFCQTLGRRVEPLDFKQEGVGRPKRKPDATRLPRQKRNGVDHSKRNPEGADQPEYKRKTASQPRRQKSC